MSGAASKNAWADPAYRIPPQNLEAERGVLGAMLLDNRKIPEVFVLLSGPEDFYRDTHQILYRAIVEIHRSGRPVDALILIEHLGQRQELERIGGEDAVAEILQATPHAENAKYHAQIVHEKASHRAVIEAACSVLEQCYAQRLTSGALGEAMVATVGRMAQRIRADAGRTARAQTTCLADVGPEAVEWLWPGVVPLGMATLLVGDPGLGKSFLTCALAAMVSRGARCGLSRLPGSDPDFCAPLGSVVMLSAEDGLANTIRPRLDAAGADVRKVHALTTIRQPDGKLTPFSLAVDLPRLEEVLDRIGDVRLITIDPVSAYLGSADEHKNSEIRAMIAPLTALAAKHRCGLVLVTHLNKGSGTKAIYRATGSLAFLAAARMGWLVGRDVGDESRTRRIMARVKCNVGPEAPGIGFRLVDGAIQWEAAEVNVDADLLLSEARGPGSCGERGPIPKRTIQAMKWIKDRLSVGPAPHGETWEAAERAGHAKATFYSALERLRVERFEADGRKFLRLSPDTPDIPDLDGDPTGDGTAY